MLRAPQKILALGACLFLLARSDAQAFDEVLARAYAGAFVVSRLAAENCPGIEQNKAALILLMSKAGIESPKDDWFIKNEFDHLKPDMQRSLLLEGAVNWCAAAWTMYGPHGLKALAKAH